jgi:hypothetical protein
MHERGDKVIITGASSAYGPSLLALLGSLTLNWPDHPPILVYDIGLDEGTRSALARFGVNTKQVPPFCPHWRRHFAWKIWAWNDAPAQSVLWIDAGIVVLRPLAEVFDAISRWGYFMVPIGTSLAVEASEAACRGCGVPAEFRQGKSALWGGFVGFRKDATRPILAEALRLALTEENLAASSPGHRHDQALLSLLAHRDLQPLQTADPDVYLMDRSPCQRPQQPLWCHRRTIRRADAVHFAAHISVSGAPFIPSAPSWLDKGFPWYRVRRWVGRIYPSILYDGVRD